MTVPSLSIDQVFTPASWPEWVTTLLTNATTLGLTTTSWQAGGITRTILSALGFVLSYQDSTASLIAQGGFLDLAASGTASYTGVDGTITTVPVTPDPSLAGNDPESSGWLDVLADSAYDVTRIRNTYAGGPLGIVNTSVATYGPFTAGTYHVADPYNNATYSNTASLTIAPSAVAGTLVGGVVSDGGVIKITTTTSHGLSTGAVVGIVGVTGVTPLLESTCWYIDVLTATTFTLRGSTFAGGYTGAGKVYVPTTATMKADAAGSVSTSLDVAGVANVHTVTSPVTTLSGVSTDNLTVFLGSDVESNVALAARCRLKLQSLSLNGPKGAYSYAALSSQQLAPDLNPPLTVAQAITRAETFVDPLTGIVHVWIASASGAPSDPDVEATDAVVQAWAVPVATTAETAAASNVSVAAAAEIWVPAAFNTDATKAVFQNALQTFVGAVPIGGVTDPDGAYENVLQFEAAEGALYIAAAAAQVTIQASTLTLNGGTADISLELSATAAQVAVLSPAVPSVTLHSV